MQTSFGTNQHTLTPNIARRLACSARGESHHHYTKDEEALLSKIIQLTFTLDDDTYEEWSESWLPLEQSAPAATTTNRMYGMPGTKPQAGDENKTEDLWNPNKRGAPKGQIGIGGFLGPCSAMLLMSLLYSARAARFDLFKPINYLAKMITRWDSLNDQRLHRLMCYIYSSIDCVLSNWIGDDPKDLTSHLYADANFAGCPYTLRSTNGEHHNIQAKNTRIAWAAASTGQTSTAQSTPEAEIVSMNTAMRSKGELGLDIWPVLLKHYHKDEDIPWKGVTFAHEDNTTAIVCFRTGQNKTMKTLERGHGVQLSWNHGRFSSDDYILIHTRTSHMTADIYTKGFNDANTWRRLRRLINVYTKEELSKGWLSPDPDSYAAKDIEGIEVDIKDVNPHYTYIMSGESELNTDFRKPAKIKPQK